MQPTLQLTERQYAELESKINDIVSNNNKSDNELYSVIGKSIHYSNDVELAPKGSKKIFKKTGQNEEWLTTESAFNLLSTPSISVDAAVESGKTFFDRLKDEIKKEICSNGAIKDFFTGDNTLINAIKVLAPAILAAVGISVINPMLMAALVAIIGLIIKAGYNSYCGI